MKRFICILVLCTSCLVCIAQPSKYVPIQNLGNIPDDFLSRGSESYQNLASSNNANDDLSKKQRKTFQLESTFTIGQLLQSGLVLYNDPLSDYVNDVAYKILKDYKQTREAVKFHVLRTSMVNAFSTSDGYIFITLGLLAQLENEAQLAMIICHEIAHFKENHVLESYMKDIEIEQGTGSYKNISRDEEMLAKLKFSRDHEYEADELALDRIIDDTPYGLEGLDHVFDVLQYSHLPVDLVPFDPSIIELGNLELPSRYKTDAFNPVHTEFEDTDTSETHPSYEKRVSILEDFMEQNPDRIEGKEFWAKEDRFHEVRHIAQMELLRSLMTYRRYEEALYHASFLLDEYEDDLFVREAIGRILYALSHYAGEEELYEFHYDYKKVEGFLTQSVYLVDQLLNDPKEMASVALSYWLNLREIYPGNDNYDFYIEELVKILAGKHHVEFDWFYTSEDLGTDSTLHSELDMSIFTDSSFTKYDKIDYLEESGAGFSELQFARYSLLDFEDDKKLEEWFEDYYEEEEEETAQDMFLLRYGITPKDPEKYYGDNFVSTLEKPVKKVIAVKPAYAFYKETSNEGNQIDHLKSESGKDDLNNSLEMVSKISRVKIEVLDPFEMNKSDEDEFNDMAFLLEYVRDRLKHPEDMDLCTLDRDRILALTDEYKTSQILLTGMIFSKDKIPIGRTVIAGLMIIPVYAWILIPRLSKDFLYYNVLIDIETNEIEFVGFDRYLGGLTKTRMNSHVYKSFDLFSNPPELPEQE